MGIVATILMYLIIGMVVAPTMSIVQRRTHNRGAFAAIVTWVVLWPFFVPALLAPVVSNAPFLTDQTPLPASTCLVAAQRRLLETIDRLDGLTKSAIRPQMSQIMEMLQTLNHAERRLQEMEQWLHSQTCDLTQIDSRLCELHSQGIDPNEPRVRSLLTQRRNIERLYTMRDLERMELERAICQLDEINSQMLLLRFVEQPDVHLAPLLQDISTRVADVAAVVMELKEL